MNDFVQLIVNELSCSAVRCQELDSDSCQLNGKYYDEYYKENLENNTACTALFSSFFLFFL